MSDPTEKSAETADAVVSTTASKPPAPSAEEAPPAPTFQAPSAVASPAAAPPQGPAAEAEKSPSAPEPSRPASVRPPASPVVTGPEVVKSVPPPAAPDPLAALQAERDALKNQLLRTMADFDNHRKRSVREKQDERRGGKEEILRELLPVFDNLERAAAFSRSASDVKAIADGVSMVLKLFTDTLTRLGGKRVQSVGAPFDPNVHEALQQVEHAEHPAGTVVQEFAPGYLFADRLLRAAMVVVSKGPAAARVPEVPVVEEAVVQEPLVQEPPATSAAAARGEGEGDSNGKGSSNGAAGGVDGDQARTGGGS